MAKQNTKTAKPVNKANEAALAKFLTDTTEVRDLKAKIKEMETIVKRTHGQHQRLCGTTCD